jgi:hypothetical protein
MDGVASLVADATGRGLLIEDAERRVVAANKTLGEIFGVPLDPHEVPGTVLANHLPATPTGPTPPTPDPPGTAVPAGDGWTQLVLHTRHAPAGTTEVELPDGRMVERTYQPLTVDGKVHGHLWLFHDQSTDAHARRVREEHSRSLGELSSLKSRFISVLSHELRTPLTSIATFVEMLSTEPSFGAEEVPGALVAIQRNTVRMLTLLADLGLLTRLESGAAGAQPEPIFGVGEHPPVSTVGSAWGTVDVVAMVGSAAALLQALAPSLTMHVQVAPGPPTRGDRGLISELLQIMAGTAAACTNGRDAYVSAWADSTQWTVRMSVTEAAEVTNDLLLATKLPAADPAAPPRSVALAMLLGHAIATNQGGTLTSRSEVQDDLTLLLRLPVR